MTTKQNTEDALVIERIFDASREQVWKAWTEPERVKRWWGPTGFTAPVAQIDFRVGGKFLMAMQSPEFNDGKPIWSTGFYREIVPLERIVCTDSFADEEGNVVPAEHYGMTGDFPLEMLLAVTFEDHDGKTKLTLRHEGLPAGEHSHGANEGWNQSLDKLAEELARA
ncbi:MAG: SRPBCC domain-containing protein [Dehalococcoidia bacterium]